MVTSRAWRRLLPDAFTAGLASSLLCSDAATLKDMQIDDLVQLYRVVMLRMQQQIQETSTCRCS